MSLPFNLNLSGGTSDARTATTLGDTGGSGGGGARGIVLNVATGSSRQAASTGSGVDLQQLWIGAAIVFAVWWLARHRK